MSAILIRRFQLTAIGEYTGQLVHGLCHPSLLRSGATRKEARQRLPGDELIPRAMWQRTRAETVQAAPGDIFPWLRQMGYGRGGWYSWLPLQDDPVRGAACRSAERILPEFQNLAVGDRLLDGPGCTPEKGAWVVKAMEPNRSIVLFAARQIPWDAEPLPDFDPVLDKPRAPWFISSWAFMLEPIHGTMTRLLLRTRCQMAPRWLFPLWFVLGNGDTVMQRTLMQGIRRRVERKSESSSPSCSLAA